MEKTITDKELSVVLRELACNQSTPLCEQWTKEWKDDSDIDTLLDKFIRGQDFCVENDYPTLEFCRKHFANRLEDLHRHNIYLDEKVAIDHAYSGFYVFLGDCTGYISADGFCAATIYLRHNSNIRVTSVGAARVFLHYFDNSDGTTCLVSGGKIRKYYKRKKEGV